MKASITLILSLFLLQICKAQNIGIGTSTPSEKLEVNGTTKTINLRITSNAGTGKVLESDSIGNASWQKSEISKLASGFPCNKLADSIFTDSNPNSVVVSGNYAYVVNSLSNTLTIYDITIDTMIIRSGFVSTGAEPSAVEVSGNYAYVVNTLSNTMTIYNVTNHSNPNQIAVISTGHRPWSITIDGIYAYVINTLGYSMSVFNISDPFNPTIAGSVNTLTNPWKVAISGNFAYVVNNTGYMTVYDITNLSNINQIASVPSDSTTHISNNPNPLFITVSNNYAYVTNTGVNSMTIFDITNPSNPKQLSSTPTGDYPLSVGVLGKYAYLTNVNSNSLSVFNISSASNPILTTTINTDSKPNSVALSGNFAYITNLLSNTLQKFYIGDCSANLNINNGSVSLSLGTWSSLNNNIYNVNSGNVGIGTTSPTALLSVNGMANKPGGGTWSTFSDMRLKNNVLPFNDGLKTLLQIRPVKFHYNELSGFNTQPEYVGILAQEIQKIAPYMISNINKNGIDYLSLDNSPITYILINSIKEQQLEIDNLKKQNEVLKKNMQDRIIELELKMNSFLKSKL